tara:strand:+ start:97 stop:330 length:234 start_codon:yes stop_codon:yes gene_type:complete
MKCKVHWIIDGIAELETETLEEAEKLISVHLNEIVSGQPDLTEKLGARAIQGKAFLPGSEDQEGLQISVVDQENEND